MQMREVLNSPSEKIKRLFMSDRFIMPVIIFNAILIFCEESGLNNVVLEFLDVLCTVIFFVEMIFKHRALGLKGYWSSGLNIMDGVLVLISLPSIVFFLAGSAMTGPSFLLVLRIFRVFRFFRLVRLFPDFAVIARNFRLAMQQSRAILLGFGVIIVTFALIGSCLFKTAAPEYFGTPLDGIYTTFRLFTIEGWYDIPDAVVKGLEDQIGGSIHIWHRLIRLYFSVLLIIGGIIGMSLINSIFVDAMVSDNNDDVKAQLREMEQKLDRLLEAQARLEAQALSGKEGATEAVRPTEEASV